MSTEQSQIDTLTLRAPEFDVNKELKKAAIYLLVSFAVHFAAGLISRSLTIKIEEIERSMA